MDGASVEHEIGRITARQHGVVTRAQLLELGLAPGSVDARVRSRRLRPLHRGVYLPGALVGALVPARAREMAAVLACGQGAVISHESAASLLDLLPAPTGSAPVHVTVERRDPRRPGIRVHRVRSFAAADRGLVDGIPTTTPARTLLDLAGSARDRQLEQAVAQAERLEYIDRQALAGTVGSMEPRRGRRRLLRILEGASPPALTRSKAEERLRALLIRAGLPLPRTNARIGGYEVDCLWPDRGVAVEVDGFAYHRSRTSFEADRRRDFELAARGIQVVRVTWRQIVDEPEALLVRLTRTLMRGAPGEPG
jgi:very-short-patch-repair endonuclease